jgi:hypothetical protein
MPLTMKKRKCLLPAVFLSLSILACHFGQTTIIPTLPFSPFDLGRTVYGFFPSPPEATTQSVLDTYQAIGRHGDVVLLQQNIPWAEFLEETGSEAKYLTDLRNQFILAHQNGLGVVFVVDPLNGLNRREFYNLPQGWDASFANPKVRNAFIHFTLRIVREFHPRYLGLASEINTYADTHPDDFPNYLSLYENVYDAVKAEAPETRVFVTFQWEELNNLMPEVAQGDPYKVNWDQIEQFEPKLDVWAISSYPFVIFRSGTEIPAEYYSPLLKRTDKPLAVAEGGFSSKPVGPFSGSPQDQVDYLTAIHDQIGGMRLAFWIYLILTDLNSDSYEKILKQQGHSGDIGTLGFFVSVGLRESDGAPKPALAVWDSFRDGE